MHLPLSSASRLLLAASIVAAFPAAASAQTEGRVSVGGSVTFVSPTDEDVSSVVGVGPLVRLNPRRGIGIAAALNWFRTDLADPAGGSGRFAKLQIRPLMAGVSYTFGSDRTLFSASVVAGPSFNSVEFEEEFVRLQGGTPAIDVDHSFVVRPGFSVTHSVAPRVGIVGFAGYMINRPNVTYRSSAGQEFDDRWRADALVLSVGAVYSLF
jgi:hypothetical protein